MELSKVMKLKKFCCTSIKQKIYFARFHLYKTYFKGHQRSGPSRGSRSGGSCFKIPSGTYFSLYIHP